MGSLLCSSCYCCLCCCHFEGPKLTHNKDCLLLHGIQSHGEVLGIRTLCVADPDTGLDSIQVQIPPRPRAQGSTCHPDQHSPRVQPIWSQVAGQTPNNPRALGGNCNHRHHPRPFLCRTMDPDTALGGPCLMSQWVQIPAPTTQISMALGTAQSSDTDTVQGG